MASYKLFPLEVQIIAIFTIIIVIFMRKLLKLQNITEIFISRADEEKSGEV